MSVIFREKIDKAFLLRALPELVAQLAHDLNNHLATVLGKSELALILDDPGRYQPALSEILDAGGSARCLVADLQRVLSWGRNASEPVLFAEVLALATRLTLRRCERVGIAIATRPDPAASGMVDDPAVLALLCWTLLRAALDEPPRGEEAWTLSGSASSGRISIVLQCPGIDWAPARSWFAARAVVSADAPSAHLERLAEGVDELAGSIGFIAGEARLEYPASR